MNVYAVDVADDAGHTWRYIVIAPSAAEADRIAVESRGDPPALVSVAGRLGKYEPGRSGAALASMWWPIVAIDDSRTGGDR